MKILCFFGKSTVTGIECSLFRFSRMIAIVGLLVFSSFLSFSASLKTVVNGVTITVSADDSVLPEGTTVSARLLTGTEEQFYLSGLSADRRVVLGQPMAFDITLHDGNGAEIQPLGDVEVIFSGLDPGEKPEELVVFHAMAAKKAPVGTFTYEIRYPSHSTEGWLKSAAIQAGPEQGVVRFTTSHFSIYLVGSIPTATYDFYVGTTKIGTQIILDGEYLLEPETPAKIDGKRFEGWYDGNTKVNFNVPIAVSETKTVKVDAKYEAFWYVYFDNEGTVATKEVAPGTTTDDTGIPLVITEEGKAFGHWSETKGGDAFDFSKEINHNTTLYAVLANRWKVSFDSHGGTTTLPIYIVSGSQMGPVTSPEKSGYYFLRWNTEPDGSGTNYTSTSVITNEVHLHAIWGPKTNTPYTVVYWQENANDDGYTYVETVNKTGTTDQPATFDAKTYTGFSLNTTKTDAAAVNIGGSGTTIRNVYYQRNRWTLTFRLNSNNSVLKTYSGIKYGQDTSPQWYEASGENPTFLWSTTQNGTTYWSAPPTMPNADLTTWGRALGSTKYEIHYLEDVTNTVIRPKFSFEGNSGLRITTEDLIELPGFTYKSYTNFNSETPKKAYIYYTRNSYVITFHKNDGSGSVNSSSIPYQASLAGKALTGFVEGVTTRDDGYVFGGWYSDPLAIENKFDFSGTMPHHNLILYGKWVAPVYTVRIHRVLEDPGPAGNSYTIELDPLGLIVESTLQKEIPTDMSETDFIGWYWYVNDNVFVPYDFYLPVSVNTIELFPVWKIATFGVTYELNGGGGTPPADNYGYFLGSYAVVLPPTGMTAPTGKVFSGWSNNGSGVYYPNVRINITGNMTLKARWSDIPGKTSLTYFANNGTTNSYNIPDLEYNQTQTVLSPDASVLGYSLSGYTFAGWNSSDDGDGDWFNTGNQVIVGKVAPNHLYAQWAKISIVKSGVFNDTNLDGVAQAGETITYTFAVKNEGFIPLVNVSVTDPKVGVTSPTSVATLEAGATTTFSAMYTLTAADIAAGKVDNSATVTGRTPILLIPVTATDSETVNLTVCSLEITCPATEVEVACPSEIPAAIAERVTTKAELEGFGFTVTDYCESLKLARTVGTIPPCEGEVPVTYTITDGEGHVATCVVTYTIKMTTAPELPANESSTVECLSEITIPVPPTGIVDQCGRTVESFDAGYVDSPSPIVCEGTRIYSWRYTDCAGQTSTWTYTYNVEDVTDPELMVPTTGLALGCNPVALPTEASVKEACSATDNCTASPTITVAAGEITGDCEKSQTFSVIASDACGNTTTKEVTYTWKEDNEAPVFANLPAGGDLGCNPATLPACDPNVTATDNCDGDVSVTCTPGDVVSNNCSRSQTFIYYAEDACGNANSEVVTYTWKEDREAPVFANLPSGGDLGCNPATLPACDSNVTATDNCDGDVSVTCTPGDIVSNNCGRSQTFTYYAEDACGNANSEVVIYTWKVDIQAPVFANLPAGGDLGCNPATLPACDSNVTATDNCDGDVTVTCTPGDIVSNNCDRSQTFTYYAEDACGNANSEVVTYTWREDTEPPLISGCPAEPIDLGLNPTIPVCHDAVQLLTRSDNCSEAIIFICAEGLILESGDRRTRVFTFTATDECDNTSTCEVTYTWISMDCLPSFTSCPESPVELGCNPATLPDCSMAIAAAGTVVNSCGGTITPTCEAGEIVEDGCKRTQEFVLTAVASHGSATCRVLYTWTEDNVAPELTVSDDVDLGCNPTAADIQAAKDAITVTADDGCGGQVSITYEEMSSAVPCMTGYKRVYTAIDECGNVSEEKSVSIFWRTDTEAPVFTNLPAGGDLGCNPATLPACDPNVTATDNCDGDVSVTCTPGEIVSNNCGRSQTFTYYAGDACGNVSTRTVTYTWTVDKVPPVLTVEGDKDLGCNPTAAAIQAAKDAITATVVDGCGGQLSITYEEMSSAVPCMTGYKRVYTAIDECGNVSEEQSVLISWKTDTEAPLFSGCPTAPIDLGLNPAVNPVCADALALVTVNDNCSGTVTPTCSAGNIQVSGDQRTQVFTLTAKDDCDNTSTCQVTYTWISMDCLPSFTNCPESPVELGCNPSTLPDCSMAIAAAGTVVNSCGGTITPTCEAGEIVEDGCKRRQEFVMTAVASHGSATCRVVYTWTEDNVAPELTVSDDVDLGCNPTPAAIQAARDAITATADDGCGGQVSITYEEMSSAIPCMTGYKRVYTAIDECGNVSEEKSVSIFWRTDTEAPLFVNLPTGGDLGCNPATLPACDPKVTATDNCDGDVTVTCTAGRITSPGAYRKSQTFTYYAEDACGNRNSATVTYTWSESAPAAEVSVTHPTCTVPVGSIYIIEPIMEGLTYSIGGEYQNSHEFTRLIPGTYTVTVMTTSGCVSGAATAVINAQPPTPPTPVISGNEGPVCPGSELTYSGPIRMAKYEWSAAGATIVGAANQRTVTVIPALGCGSEFSLTLEVTNEHGCKASSSIAVNIGAEEPLSLTPSGNYTVERTCLSQDDVNIVFGEWLNKAYSNGGCTRVLSHDGEGRAPDACGGSVVVTWTLTDACSETLTASSTFTIPAAPAVVLTVPASYSIGIGKTQAEIDAAYATWKAGGSFTGGCGASISNNAPANAPSATDGGFYTVTWIIESDCEEQVSKTSTFSVAASPPVVLVVPKDYTGTQCMTQSAVNTAYNNWLGSATFTGGCDPVLSNDGAGKAPDACGGSVVVTWTVTSECGAPASGTATFTIPAAPALSYSIPENFTGDACMTQTEIDETYDNWLEDFGIIEGGCNPDLSYFRPEVNPQACEGVAISVPWILTSDCGPTVTGTATFTIPAAPEMALTVPEDKEVGSCLTQDQVNTEYQAWLAIANVEGGCNPQLLVEVPEAPSFCGGSVVVYWTAESSCAGDSKSATFTVSQAPAVSLTVPASYYSGIGKTQAEVDADYAAWIAGGSFTGGCGASLSNNAPVNAPSALFGGVYTVTWTVESDCFDQVRDFSTFSVAAAPPVVLLVPEDFTGTQCMTQSAVNTAYNNWLGSATFEGGCNPVLSNDGAGKAPDACGGSVVVTWTVTSECGAPATGTATFTIPAAPAVTYNVPEDYTGETCMSSREIRAALSDWLAEFSVEGGCGAEIYAQTPESLPEMCEGGTVLVPWTVSSDCGETISGTATFTIPAAPAVVLHVPADFTCTTCTTQADVDVAYKEWLMEAYFTGGCNAVMTNNAPELTPGVCDRAVASVTWTVTGSCGEDVVKTSTFSVPGGPELVLADVHCVYLNERGMWTLNSSDVSQITAGTKGENLKFTFSQRTFECKDVYPPLVPVTVTVTDGRGCQSTGSFNMQVLDTLPPVAICRDITVQLDANGQVLVPPGFVNDGGDRENVPEWYKFFKDLEGGSYDNCGVAEMYLSKSIFTRADVGPNQVILTVVDPSGNTGECQATVTVVDPYAEPSTGPGDDTPGNGRANTAPTLADITDVMVMDEALQLEVTLFGISAGAETDQKVTVMAVSDNPELIPGIAVIYTEGSTGRLMLTVGAGVSGEAWITVTVKDDGGTANGGKDMIQKRFKVTVEAGGIGVTDPDGDDIVAGVTDPDEGDVVTGVIDVTSEMDFRLYPNPTRGKLTIEMTGAGIRDAEVTIYSLQGAMVFKKAFRAGEQIEIDMTPYTSGVYMVRTDVEGTTFMRKVILDK